MKGELKADVRLGSAVLLLLAISASAQTPADAPAAKQTPEERASLGFEAARENPLHLRTWLWRMPKGADLHNHLLGAVYAESWMRFAAEDGLCIDLATHALENPPSGPKPRTGNPACGEGKVPASQALQDQRLYDTLVNAFSMRGFVASPAETGHDHFFNAFAKFLAIDQRHTGEWLDEVATRAAEQNVQYVELMDTPPLARASQLAREIGWREDLASLREEFLSRGLRGDVSEARTHWERAEALRRRLERCGQPGEKAACQVQIRFLHQVLRAMPKELVFAQILLGFEIAASDPRVVGINLVQPEDALIPMTDYTLHMRMVGFLHDLYPQVHIALHAGELAPGLVPPEALCCHIRQAVEQAHAERIGHGVDVTYESRPHQLMREMAAGHVAVEVNLTSNDLILGVAGRQHPFPIYRQFRVPLVLSTDDEGVSRIDLTHEFQRAVESYDLHYADLKQMVRASLEHSFLPGASLWREGDLFTLAADPCAQEIPGNEKPAGRCSAFLAGSEKARQQWELERRFRIYEESF